MSPWLSSTSALSDASSAVANLTKQRRPGLKKGTPVCFEIQIVLHFLVFMSPVEEMGYNIKITFYIHSSSVDADVKLSNQPSNQVIIS